MILKILVTGATGFIGRLVVAACWANGQTVVAIGQVQATMPEQPGIYNFCVGVYTKVIDLIKRRIDELGATFELDTTAYTYLARVAMANLGANARLSALLQPRLLREVKKNEVGV